MAVVYSSTTPSDTESGWVGTQSTTIVSNAFSPPANSLIVVVVSASEGFNSVWDTPTFTDSLGSHLTWTLARAQADSVASFGACWVAWANCPSAQTNMTVSVTLGIADASQYILGAMLQPLVFTGADTTAPIVNISSGLSSTNSASVGMTPIYAGSNLLIAAARIATDATADTAGAGCYLKTSYVFGAAHGIAWYGTSTNPTATAGNPQTMALTTTDTGNAWQYVAFEIAPPHGAPAAGTGWVIGGVEW